jgi:lauroyl/myristoyl acyltransferase
MGSRPKMKDRPHVGFRKALETFGLALGFALVPHLPRRLVVSLAVFLGESGYLVSRRDRTLAILNLRAAYGPGKSMAWR